MCDWRLSFFVNSNDYDEFVYCFFYVSVFRRGFVLMLIFVGYSNSLNFVVLVSMDFGDNINFLIVLYSIVVLN